jgi:hypothetical protein
MPNHSRIQATHTCQIYIPDLPTKACEAHLFPDLAHALLSIGLLCDHVCTAIFDKQHVKISYKNAIILTGYHDPETNLWKVPLQPTPAQTQPAQPAWILPYTQHHANSAYHTSTQIDLVTYLHAACGSPVPSTWIKAINNGHFATWPGLTAKLVREKLPKSIATVKGHLNRQRKNIRSTQPRAIETDANEDSNPPSDSPNQRSHHVFAAVTAVTGQISTDITGQFPITSGRGNKYILVLYDYDSNAILAEPMKNRSDNEHLRAYNKLHQFLVDRGFKPLLQKLDNEASNALKQTMRDKDIDFQLVPPHTHRRNAAERAIQTFKNHFVACLCTADKFFPMRLWDRILPQATTTLNLLRTSRLNPRLSSEAHLNGTFDFNRTPLAPLGTRVIVHETPEKRRSWAIHGQEGWYLGHAPEHYRCYRVFVTSTAAERIAETVDFFPATSNMPRTSSADAATKAASSLIHALQNPAPAAPFAALGDRQQQALEQLANIFANSISTTPASPRVAKNFPILRQQSPRVPEPSPRVANNQATPNGNNARHRYPTRYSQSPTPTPHAANHIGDISPADLIPAAPLEEPKLPKHFAHSLTDPTTGDTMEYRHLIKNPKTSAKWTRSFANELGRLANGVGTRMKTGTNTIKFIERQHVPKDRTVTYGRIVVSIRPQKAEGKRTRLTVGGNLIDYPGDVSTKTAGLTTAKVLFNSVISTPNAKFMGIDLKNFYLNTPLDRYEYMKMPIALIPQEIIEEYNLQPLVHQGFVYIEIQKGMYGLPQAGILASKLLQKRLAAHGYAPTDHTHGLWKHHTRPILFSLVVDDFGVKYVGKQHADHLYNALEENYEAACDWEGKLYCGVSLDWNYQQRTVDLSMPGYVTAALHKYQHKTPKQHCSAPSQWTAPQYGSKVQMAKVDDTPPMNAEQTHWLQQVVGTFSFYARAVDPTMLHALNVLAASQKRGTQATVEALVHFLNYAATHPNAKIRYRASAMVLHVHSDASYLTEPEARSRAGGHHFLSDQASHPNPTPNGPILNIAKILRNVMSSAAEAEVGALFLNAKEATVL